MASQHPCDQIRAASRASYRLRRWEDRGTLKLMMMSVFEAVLSIDGHFAKIGWDGVVEVAVHGAILGF